MTGYEEIDTEALLYVLGDVPGRLAPYVPTPHWLRRQVAAILGEEARSRGLDVVYEPGCGAGEAAEAIEGLVSPRYYIGLEIDADLAKRAKRRVVMGDVVVGDLRAPPLRARPLAIYAYLLPKPLTIVARLAPPGSVIVSLEYRVEEPVEGLVEEKRVEIDTVITRHVVTIYVKKGRG